jgi:hypothetical protein
MTRALEGDLRCALVYRHAHVDEVWVDGAVTSRARVRKLVNAHIARNTIKIFSLPISLHSSS